MTNAVCSIIRSVTRKPDDKLNIVLFNKPRYEEYNLILSHTGHNFYLWTSSYKGKWEGNKPPNVYHLPSEEKNVDKKLDFDLIICHSRLTQFDMAQSLAHAWHLPFISIHHDMLSTIITSEDGQQGQMDQAKFNEYIQRNGDFNVFDSLEIMNSWNTIGQVIEPELTNEFINQWNNLFEQISSFLYVR